MPTRNHCTSSSATASKPIGSEAVTNQTPPYALAGRRSVAGCDGLVAVFFLRPALHTTPLQFLTNFFRTAGRTNCPRDIRTCARWGCLIVASTWAINPCGRRRFRDILRLGWERQGQQENTYQIQRIEFKPHGKSPYCERKCC